MDGREDEIVLVEQRRAGKIAARARRIERELREKCFARRELCRDALELFEVRGARRRGIVDAQELRLVPLAGATDLPFANQIGTLAGFTAGGDFTLSDATPKLSPNFTKSGL